jgi:outer membrane protein assembly factor BamB
MIAHHSVMMHRNAAFFLFVNTGSHFFKEPSMNFSRPLAFCAILCLAFPTSASDWTCWRGPNHNSTVNESNLSWDWSAKPPTQLWKVNTGASYSAVCVQGNRVYTMGNDKGKDTIFCLNADTGKTIWAHAEAQGKRDFQADPVPNATTATPVLDGNRVYTISREGLVLCLDAGSGKVLWRKRVLSDFGKGIETPPFGFAGSALIDGGNVLFNVGHHGMALNKLTGALVWKSSGLAGHATPVAYKVGNRSGVAFFNGSGIVGTDPKTGKLLWEHKWKTEYDINATDPVFDDEGVFISTWGRAQKLKLGSTKPTVAYETRTMQHTTSSPVRIGNYLYGNSKGRLACMELATGKPKWDLPGIGDGNVLVIGDKLLALAEKGELIVVDAAPNACRERARFPVMEGGKCVVHPTLANGRLYCRSVEGDLVCLDLRK